jgi:hypothetical protein
MSWEDNPKLYDVARDVCWSFGFPWTDPRTGVTHMPPISNPEPESDWDVAKKKRHYLELAGRLEHYAYELHQRSTMQVIDIMEAATFIRDAWEGK